MCLNCRRLKEEKAVLEAKLVQVANELLLLRREQAAVPLLRIAYYGPKPAKSGLDY